MVVRLSPTSQTKDASGRKSVQSKMIITSTYNPEKKSKLFGAAAAQLSNSTRLLFSSTRQPASAP